MISCHKCKQSNPVDAKLCQNCGANFLPGESISGRLGILFGGIFWGVLSAVMVYFLVNNPEITETSGGCMFTNPVIWVIGGVILPISGIVAALRKTPVYQRYENRASCE